MAEYMPTVSKYTFINRQTNRIRVATVTCSPIDRQMLPQATAVDIRLDQC